MPLLLLLLTAATAAASSCDPPHFFTGVSIPLANNNRTGESAMRGQRHRVAVLYNDVLMCPVARKRLGACGLLGLALIAFLHDRHQVILRTPPSSPVASTVQL